MMPAVSHIQGRSREHGIEPQYVPVHFSGGFGAVAVVFDPVSGLLDDCPVSARRSATSLCPCSKRRTTFSPSSTSACSYANGWSHAFCSAYDGQHRIFTATAAVQQCGTPDSLFGTIGFSTACPWSRTGSPVPTASAVLIVSTVLIVFSCNGPIKRAGRC